ncbi:MAG TPA: class I SAM-dependent methyltransferase [Hyphomonadaceae bacterium]|nr:class I SAM-dependent methyltransferase [Hyphomonadaceae bacterium]
MSIRPPSKTAFAAAGHRAAHQVVEQGRVFSDPFAVRILGVSPDIIRTETEANPGRAAMRFFLASRSRIAEDAIAESVATRGLSQLVVLGAGLDTFAYRNPFAGKLRVFEVDHAGTQTWKRQRLAETGIDIPADISYVPVDFERDRLMDQLYAAGLDPKKRTFFMWLGVVPYLTRAAIAATLKAAASVPGGAEIAFDYGNPHDSLPPEIRASAQERAERVAALGEPFLSFFEDAEMHALLKEAGFTKIDDLNPAEIAERILPPEVIAAAQAAGRRRPTAGGHIVVAMTS